MAEQRAHLLFGGGILDAANLDDAEILRRYLRRRGFLRSNRFSIVPGNHDIWPVGEGRLRQDLPPAMMKSLLAGLAMRKFPAQRRSEPGVLGEPAATLLVLRQNRGASQPDSLVPSPRTSTQPVRPPELRSGIRCCQCGPRSPRLAFMADPIIPQYSPIVVEEEPGVKWWCACGRSKSQPFCDGSHQGTGITPMRIEIKEKRRIAWCACKHSKTMPFCDGTHSKLPRPDSSGSGKE